ncbi:DUF3857 and transglutaminase domain-containing protein [Marinifilum caeruleilacunae]|uniref:DUF3857 domain-containing protein n=1 Tax=Marinifilum caeruleilacunae TaxID=2499076 RepID=A0ABX1WS20_9BACT|nr:DUF3857 and transglutaminase domain-containing protein [Marinifilum caeruleilacunae]NOU58729.1 DUF3857 domain-containing protein [Marinifilum caeruleilacunae]
MEHSIKLSLIFICIVLISFQSRSEKHMFAYFSDYEIKMTQCDYEKDANAVVLGKFCEVNIKRESIHYNYHVRIKILREEGFDWADVELPYFRNNELEKIIKLKGQTVNFDSNGKRTTHVLNEESFFFLDVNENYGAVRFSLPQIKVGSIIEYKYTLVSKINPFLDTWYFQEKIPTLKSSIKVNENSIYQFKAILFGERVNCKYWGCEIDQWTLYDLKSIKEEAFVNNCKNYTEQIRFQLAGYATGTGYVPFGATWDELAKEYLESFKFLARKNAARKIVNEICSETDSSRDKLQKIYDFVRTQVKWNKKYRIYPKKSPKRVLEDKIGSNSEINFLLVLLLREAGIKSEPALTRTNKSGYITKDFPLLSQFNQALAYVEIDGESLFLNATSECRPYWVLDEDDLNLYAFVMEKEKGYWKDIEAFSNSRSQIVMSYDLSDIKKPKCKLRIQETGYYALSKRELIQKDDGLEWFINQLIGDLNYEINDKQIQVKNADDIDKPIMLTSEFLIDSKWREDDILYFEPFPKILGENPFLSENRLYPIEFNYPMHQTVLINIKLPSTYQVRNFPGNKTIQLPKSLGSFKIMGQNKDEYLQLRSEFVLKETRFSKEYYPLLREMFSYMLSSLSAQVVIQTDNSYSSK